MPDIFALASDSRIFSANAAYSTARSATTGTVDPVSNTTAIVGIVRFSARGGGNTVRINRLFFDFDTSGISVTPSSAELKFRINGQATETSNSNLIAVKSNAFTNSNALQDSDYNNIDISTPYTVEIDSESASAGDTITVALNSDALSDIAANDNFRLALINHAHDFTNSEPSDTLNRTLTIKTANYSGTSSDPKITYVAGAAGPANLTSLNGIAKASITNVNTITVANITSINTIA